MDMELEPAVNLAATHDVAFHCDECELVCAANALQTDRSTRHCVAFLDADFQKIVTSWETVPPSIRKAILVLLDRNPVGSPYAVAFNG